MLSTPSWGQTLKCTVHRNYPIQALPPPFLLTRDPPLPSGFVNLGFPPPLNFLCITIPMESFGFLLALYSTPILLDHSSHTSSWLLLLEAFLTGIGNPWTCHGPGLSPLVCFPCFGVWNCFSGGVASPLLVTSFSSWVMGVTWSPGSMVGIGDRVLGLDPWHQEDLVSWNGTGYVLNEWMKPGSVEFGPGLWLVPLGFGLGLLLLCLAVVWPWQVTSPSVTWGTRAWWPSSLGFLSPPAPHCWLHPLLLTLALFWSLSLSLFWIEV